jgi:hypothetical protein
MRVGRSSIEDKQHGQEGRTVYFVLHRDRKKRSEPVVIAGCILRTMEYRFFKKIGTRLAAFNSIRTDRHTVIQRYQK